METAYPTAPQPGYPTSYPSTHCVRRLILAILLSFATISFIITIEWLVLHPQAPVFQVNSLSVSNFTLSKSPAAANYEINLTVTNPNPKIDLQFGISKIFLYYKKYPLSRVRVDPFDLRRKMNQSRVIMSKLESNYRIKKKIAIDMDKDRSKGEVSFSVRMEVWAKFMAGEWLSKEKSMKVICENLKVGFSSPTVTGKLMSGRKDCTVHFL